MGRRNVTAACALLTLLTLLTLAGCAEKPTPAPVTTASTATASASPKAAPGLPSPTKVDDPSLTGMRYYHWDPPVDVTGEGVVKRAEQVLASGTIQKLLGVDPAKDGFRHYQTTKDHKVVFIQTLTWKGKTLPVHRAMATVELKDGKKLAYVGTGFQRGISLSNDELTVDEQEAAAIAAKEYERLEQAPGKVTAHRHPGLNVYRALGGIHLPGYDIHVERADTGGHSRPYLILVNAQTGQVVRSKKSWVE
ncbi:MAG: protein phosphatase 2C family protein [Deltaproteobacteria bacterium]|nr:protein phosphatase 2C family protein [Deltaproteobacteria bacterium]